VNLAPPGQSRGKKERYVFKSAEKLGEGGGDKEKKLLLEEENPLPEEKREKDKNKLDDKILSHFVLERLLKSPSGFSRSPTSGKNWTKDGTKPSEGRNRNTK